MPKIVDGTPVDAATTNAALLGRTADDTATGKISLGNTDPASGSSITNIQREMNADASFMGKSTNVAEDALPAYGNNDGFTPNEDLRTRVDAITGRFDSSTGHGHTGTPGDGPQIPADNVGSVILKGFGIQGTTLTGVTGGSTDVTTQLTGKSPSGNTSTRGVVTNTPYNKVLLRDINDDEIKNGTGDTIYGRVTFSISTWTLTYYYDNAGTETAYSFGSATDVKWYYQELINYIADTGYVYSPMFFIPSDNATADVVDASASQRGLVSTGTQSFAGLKTMTDGLIIEDLLRYNQQVDSSTTGSNQTLAPTQPYIKLTNASLASVEMISSPANSKIHVITNGVGATVTFLHNTGATAANRIDTGTGIDLDVADGASIWVIYDTNGSRWKVVGGSGSGSGGGVAKNYLPFGNAESTNPFVMYADGSSIPVNGTGGSPTATITQSTSSPLAGVKSFLFTSGGIGDGGAYAFTIDAADKSSVQTLILSTDGAFVQDDLSLWLFDITNSTLISPQPNQYPQPSFGKQQFIFQIGSGTSYRFLIHQASANSFTAKFEVSLSMMPFAGYAPIKTDDESVTPVFAQLGTVTAISIRMSQDGQDMLLHGNFTTGTVGSGSPYIEMPNGQLIDDTKYPSGVVSIVGKVVRGVAAATDGTYMVNLVYNGSDNTKLYFTTSNGGDSPTTVTSNATAQFNNNEIQLIAWARIAIKGWTSETKVISEYDGRVVAARLSGDPASTGAGNIIIFPISDYDTHSAYNVSTGRFTAPISGYLKVSVAGLSAVNGVQIVIWINGVADIYIGQTDPNGEAFFSGTIKVVAGDLVDIRPAGGALDLASGSLLYFEYLSGSQQILAGQKIEVSYYASANKSTGPAQPLDFDTKEFDTTPGWVTTGSGWRFTSYISATYAVVGASFSSTGDYAILYKNGSAYKHVGAIAYTTNSAGSWVTYIQLQAEDYIDIRASTNITALGGSMASAGVSNIAIKQVN